jgi:hypothetical protein
MFYKSADGYWYFRYGETEKHECKQNFGFKHPGKWLRAIAALSNNKGGHLLFGIKDKEVINGAISEDSFRVYGMHSKEFENADPADISRIVRATFDPTPSIEISSYDLEGKQVGIIYVHQHTARPVIAVRNVNEIKEGDIYFRYPGISTRIKYSDLRSILDERDRHAREQILPMVQKILDRGPEKTMVADLSDGTLGDAHGSIFLNEDLVRQISFIKEGEFSEKSGKPTLRLVGNVKTYDPNAPVVRREFITTEDLFRDFISQAETSNPKEYIRCAIEGSTVLWAPIFFFSRQANLDSYQLAQYISALKASKKRKDIYSQRARGDVSAYRSEGGMAEEFRAELEDGRLPEIDDPKLAASFGRALTALSSRPPLSLKELLAVVSRSFSVIEQVNKPELKSPIRRGIARLDELYYGLQYNIS